MQLYVKFYYIIYTLGGRRLPKIGVVMENNPQNQTMSQTCDTDLDGIILELRHLSGRLSRTKRDADAYFVDALEGLLIQYFYTPPSSCRIR